MAGDKAVLDRASTGLVTDNLDTLLGQLRQAGQAPDPALLDCVAAYGQAAVWPLIDMAVDRELHCAPQDRPEVWAPLHAIQILGELGAPEATEPLLALFDSADDWLAKALPEAMAGLALRR